MIDCEDPMRLITDSSSFLTHSMNKNLKGIIDNLFRFIFEESTHMNSTVHIRDIETVRKKIHTLILAGSDKLQVVSDFDRTMSKYRHNGTLNPTCHGIFEMDPELTTEAKEKLTNLRNKYYPIEVDSKMSDAEKIPHMLDWWNASHATIVSCGLHRDALAKTVRECGLVLRDGVTEFTALLDNHNIPLLIFSAGLGDVIKLLLDNFGICNKQMRIVSNFMEFNDEGLLTEFSTPIIHSFNKTASSIANGDYAQISSTRPCVLLLGDSTGDVHMADGATKEDPDGSLNGTVLRIGFLNESVETHLDKYKSIYDIVLVNEDTFAVPLAIAESILRCHRTFAEEKRKMELSQEEKP